MMLILRSRLAAFAALAMLPLAAACASGGEDRYDAEPGDNFATLVVENDNTENVTVYALRTGTRQRMGTVPGMSTERFEIRRSMLTGGGKLTVGMNPPGPRCRWACTTLGSTRMYTYPILVHDGDEIGVTVSDFLSRGMKDIRITSQR